MMYPMSPTLRMSNSDNKNIQPSFNSRAIIITRSSYGDSKNCDGDVFVKTTSDRGGTELRNSRSAFGQELRDTWFYLTEIFPFLQPVKAIKVIRASINGDCARDRTDLFERSSAETHYATSA